MNIISNILYWISTGLLVPVIVLLIFFFIRAIILIGTFFGQYLQVKKHSESFYARIVKLTPATLDSFSEALPEKSDTVVTAYAKKIIASHDNHARIDLLLSEYEIEADKELSTSKVLTKMGPILGLMGTLIPMGPALVGLATGDIASMAYNMQVAFATTVIGLVISAIGFIVLQMRQRWLFQDLTNLEYIAQL